jgi:hypothetical protein
MKKKVYIETTIPSYITAALSNDIIIVGHQKLTIDWWENNSCYFDLFTSEIVLDEIGKGDRNQEEKRIELLKKVKILDFNNEVEALGIRYFNYFNLPKKALFDAYHIAIAVYYEIDFLLTWNCRNLANANVRKKLAEYNIKEGYKIPDMCTPEELIPWEDGNE